MYQQVKGIGEYFQGTSGMGGLGAYYAPKYERAINGLGKVGCGCSGVGDDAAVPAAQPGTTGMSSSAKGALMIGAAGVVLIALCVVPNIWDG